MKTTPKDFFLWVAAQGALLACTVSLLALWFDYIDHLWGDQTVQYVSGYSSSIVSALSTLIVIFPLFIWFTKALHDDMRAHPEKKELWVRRWLIVATIALAGLTLVIDLIVLIQTFLSGEELTLSFVLKVLSVLVVVGSLLVYYLQEMKGTWLTRKKESQIIAGALVLVVSASIIGAFLIIGSPRSQRLMRYDTQKVSDLQNLQSQVTTFYQQKTRLPQSIDELNDPLSYMTIPTDPQASDGMRYEYTTTGELTFSLCATFNKESQESKNYVQPVYPENEHWEHAAGKVCFDRTIDPDKYPPYPKAAPVQ